jgi:gas vesicle protein
MKASKLKSTLKGNLLCAVENMKLLTAATLLGLLLAPKAGKQLRKDLRKRYEVAKDTVEEWSEDAKEFAENAMERGAEIADEVRERVAPLAKAMRR